jgi:hypothetical protein
MGSINVKNSKYLIEFSFLRYGDETHTVLLLGQGKVYFIGNGILFPRSATRNGPSSGALSVTKFTEQPTRLR